MRLKHRYSRWRSKRFWKKINAIKNTELWDKAYGLGVQLQNQEEECLRRINHIILVDRQ